MYLLFVTLILSQQPRIRLVGNAIRVAIHLRCFHTSGLLVVETERYIRELTHDQSDHYSRESDNEHTCEYDLITDNYTFNNCYFLIVCKLSHIILYLILLVLIR